MRLWAKQLIPYLPRLQLIAQWRECCCIAKNVADNGTPNHILVNKIMNYHPFHFSTYSNIIACEMKRRGYNVTKKSVDNFIHNFFKGFSKDIHGLCISTDTNIPFDELFKDWHNERYLKQCLFNLQEKHDCNGISDEEWKVIEYKFGYLLGDDK